MKWHPFSKLEEAVTSVAQHGHPVEFKFLRAGRRYGVVLIREARRSRREEKA